MQWRRSLLFGSKGHIMRSYRRITAVCLTKEHRNSSLSCLAMSIHLFDTMRVPYNFPTGSLIWYQCTKYLFHFHNIYYLLLTYLPCLLNINSVLNTFTYYTILKTCSTIKNGVRLTPPPNNHHVIPMFSKISILPLGEGVIALSFGENA